MQNPALLAAEQDSDSVSLTGLQAVLSGSLIATQRGEIAAEALRPGDKVVSRDRGLVPLRWSGQITVNTRRT
ncbi:MAG: Hint domain-containing protein, partial [Rhodobacteraceae bacterium]|nr:Hint domain-containing protein [Paracoccaceae bacterium]